MSGRRLGYSPRYSQSPSRGGARRGSRGDPGVFHNSRGRSSRSLRGSQGRLQQNHTSPIFSSPHGAQPPSLTGRTSLISGFDLNEQSGLRQLMSSALDQFPLPDSNSTPIPPSSLPDHVLPPSAGLPGNSPLPPSWSPQAHSLHAGEAAIPLQRREDIIMAIDIRGIASDVPSTRLPRLASVCCTTRHAPRHYNSLNRS